MARYEMDHDGIGAARSAVSGDPALLRDVAAAVSAAAGAARSAVGPEQAGLAAETERFRLVHATLLDAMADAVEALFGDLDLAVRSDRETEAAVAGAFGGLAGSGGGRDVSGGRDAGGVGGAVAGALAGLGS